MNFIAKSVFQSVAFFNGDNWFGRRVLTPECKPVLVRKSCEGCSLSTKLWSVIIVCSVHWARCVETLTENIKRVIHGLFLHCELCLSFFAFILQIFVVKFSVLNESRWQGPNFWIFIWRFVSSLNFLDNEFLVITRVVFTSIEGALHWVSFIALKFILLVLFIFIAILNIFLVRIRNLKLVIVAGLLGDRLLCDLVWFLLAKRIGPK